MCATHTHTHTGPAETSGEIKQGDVLYEVDSHYARGVLWLVMLRFVSGEERGKMRIGHASAYVSIPENTEGG